MSTWLNLRTSFDRQTSRESFVSVVLWVSEANPLKQSLWISFSCYVVNFPAPVETNNNKHSKTEIAALCSLPKQQRLKEAQGRSCFSVEELYYFVEDKKLLLVLLWELTFVMFGWLPIQMQAIQLPQDKSCSPKPFQTVNNCHFT